MKIYLVGGAVRDELLGRPSNDRDYVVVGATEAEMLALGYKKVGADFPVFMNEAGDQFALARKERKTGRGYLGFETTFDPTVTLEDDLLRRDLTINAMAKDVETGEIVDPFYGKQDLLHGNLRHVSVAFKEDPLRVVRLARFYARWTDFKIVPETIVLAQHLVQAGELNDLADERLYAELEKTFQQSKKPSRFFYALNVFEAIGRVRFFNDLMGIFAPPPMAEKVADIVKILPDEFQLPTFLAIAGRGPMTSTAIPTYVKKLAQAYQKAEQISPTAEGAYELLAATRGFDTTSKINDLVMVIGISERAGKPLPLSSETLKHALHATRSVTAEQFMHLKGKAIGEALSAERLNKLRSVIV